MDLKNLFGKLGPVSKKSECYKCYENVNRLLKRQKYYICKNCELYILYKEEVIKNVLHC